MRHPIRNRGPSRRQAFSVEAMEARDLLTVLPMQLANLAHVSRAIRQATATLGASATSATTPAPVAIPTAHEKARQAFGARFQGPFTTGPGRFTNEALRTHLNAGGTANQFFHGNVLIEIATPKDPTQPVTGIAALYAKNVSTTGTVLILDLSGTAPADPRQPPSHLTWTVDASSGGLYSNATGQGTLDLIYTPRGKRSPRAFLNGNAGAIFKGQVNTTGVGNILQFSG